MKKQSLNRRAFTLMELLAVIVVLAIIATITTPIILDTINNTKESTQKTSAEMYLNAVEQAIAKENLKGKFNPSTCIIQNTGNIKCDGETNEIEIKVAGNKPASGTINLKEEKIIAYKNINIEGKYVTQGVGVTEKPTTTCVAVTNSKTGNVPQGNYSLGDEYVCEVGEEKNYNFFILSVGEKNVNLILESNIDEDGQLVKSGTAGNTPWYASNPTTIVYGPLTALNYLESATEDWTYLDKIIINTFEDDAGNAYDMQEYKLYARLPKLLEIENTGCQYRVENSCPYWLVNYLASGKSDPAKYPNRDLTGLVGYWLQDAVVKWSKDNAYLVQGDGYTTYQWGTDAWDKGIRPVITVPKVALYNS